MLQRSLAILLSLSVVAFPVLGADFSAPVIESVSVIKPTSYGDTFQFKATVREDHVINSVKLFYRVVGSKGRYWSLVMQTGEDTPDVYSTELPRDVLQSNGIEYYVEARDLANNIAQHPFPDSPEKLIFKIGGSDDFVAPGWGFKRGSQWGASVYYGDFSVEDPDGDAGKISEPGYSLLFSYGYSGRWRLWFELSNQEFILPYSQSQIGQDVKSLVLSFAVQRSMSVFESLMWMGIGIVAENNKIIDRATANNGIIVSQYEDRSESGYGWVIDFGYELGSSKTKSYGVHAALHRTLGNGVNSAALGVYLLFE